MDGRHFYIRAYACYTYLFVRIVVFWLSCWILYRCLLAWLIQYDYNINQILYLGSIKMQFSHIPHTLSTPLHPYVVLSFFPFVDTSYTAPLNLRNVHSINPFNHNLVWFLPNFSSFPRLGSRRPSFMNHYYRTHHHSNTSILVAPLRNRLYVDIFIICWLGEIPHLHWLSCELGHSSCDFRP